jgi:hypothetical protein
MKSIRPKPIEPIQQHPKKSSRRTIEPPSWPVISRSMWRAILALAAAAVVVMLIGVAG